MSLLRVLVTAPLHPDSVQPWALFDAGGRLIDRGRGTPAQWPASDRREAIIGADAVRMVALSLPPLPRDRLLAAATYALEERLATSPEDAIVALGANAVPDRVVAIATSRDLAQSLLALQPPFARAIAEPELARPVDGWRWCEGSDSAFVRTQDGGAFAVARASGATLPPELSLSLAQASRDGTAPRQVAVDCAADSATLSNWQAERGVPFVPGTPWHWERQPGSAFRAATDVLAAVSQLSTSTPRARPVFAVAGAVLAAAAVVHVLAALGTWVSQRFELARTTQQLVPLAQHAGVGDANAGNAAAGIAAQLAAARHRAGRDAPNDAMPMLARAAPALAGLPAGTLRTATWSAGAWTLELGPLDDAALSRLVAHAASAGLLPLHARSASGVRVRLTLEP